MKTTIRAATLHDVEPVARQMRARDVEEVRAATGLDPHAALLRCLEGDGLAWTLHDAAGPYAIYGVSHVALDIGSPWFLATDRLYRHIKFFMHGTPVFVRHMQDRYPILMNYVDARHQDSIRWLRWAGFTFDKYIETFGHERRPFIRFTKYATPKEDRSHV